MIQNQFAHVPTLDTHDLTALCATAVPMWLAQTNVASNTVSASAGSLTDAVTSMLSTSQPDQMPVAQSNLIANMMSDVTDTDSSIILELTVDVGPSGGERVVRRGVTIGAADFGSSVADLIAEVDL